MQVNVKYFGMLRDCAQRDIDSIELLGEVTVGVFREIIHKKNPGLKEKSYKVACNRKIVDDNFIISTNDEIALLPPFSGG